MPRDDYEERQNAKRERLTNRSAKAAEKSTALYQQSHEATQHIPFGQPILIGHHSEKRHRRDLQRSWDKMGQSVELHKQAEKLQDRAQSVGTGGISSDDPEAINKLQAKLVMRQNQQEAMKAGNKAYALLLKHERNEDNLTVIKALEALDASYPGYRQAVLSYDPTKNYGLKRPFAPYQLSNNNAEIRRLKQRIAKLQSQFAKCSQLKASDTGPIEIAPGLRLYRNPDQNRLQLLFDDIPNTELRKLLKKHGFRWSRFNKAWQRMLNNNSEYSLKRLLSSSAFKEACADK